MNIHDSAALGKVNEDQIQVLIDMGMTKCAHCKGLREFVIDWMLNRNSTSTGTLICALSYILKDTKQVSAERTRRFLEFFQSPRVIVRYYSKDIPRLLATSLISAGVPADKVCLYSSLELGESIPREYITIFENPKVPLFYDGGIMPELPDIRTVTLRTGRYRARIPDYSLWNNEEIVDMVNNFKEAILRRHATYIYVWDWIGRIPIINSSGNVIARDFEIAVAM